MRLIDKRVECPSRTNTIEIYPIGDIHLGARNCAEKPLRKQVREIAQNPNAFVIGTGDWLDAIKPQDTKRFDFDCLPDWVVEGDADTTRDKLNDIIKFEL